MSSYKRQSSDGNSMPMYNGQNPNYYYPQMPQMSQGAQGQAGGQPGFNQVPQQGQQAQQPQTQAQAQTGAGGFGNGTLPQQQSYIENILRLNEGKRATVYMTFENNERWNAKVFKGIIEAAGRDHIILRDRETGMRYLLLMIYLDYITFDEELNYQYPYGNGGTTPTYPSR